MTEEEFKCTNPSGCACKEANGYPLTDCQYWESAFKHCSDCDIPDACDDFGCAREQGLRSDTTNL